MLGRRGVSLVDDDGKFVVILPTLEGDQYLAGRLVHRQLAPLGLAYQVGTLLEFLPARHEPIGVDELLEAGQNGADLTLILCGIGRHLAQILLQLLLEAGRHHGVLVGGLDGYNERVGRGISFGERKGDLDGGVRSSTVRCRDEVICGAVYFHLGQVTPQLCNLFRAWGMGGHRPRSK